MSVTYGVAAPPQRIYPSLYECFENLVAKEENTSKTAFVTHNGFVTIKDLNIMVDSLSSWLYKKLKKLCTENSSNDHEENASRVVASELPSKCFAKLWKLFGENNKEKIKKENIKEEAVIAVCLNRGPEFAALILAIWKLHIAFVPLDPFIPVMRTKKVVQESKPLLIIGDRHTLDGLKDVMQNISSEDTKSSASDDNGSKIIYEDNIETETESEDEERQQFGGKILDLEEWKLEFYESASEPKLERVHDLYFLGISSKYKYKASGCLCKNTLACVIYTSGSKGIPKGVKITTQNFINRLSWQWKAYPFDSKDVCLWSKLCTFIDSFTELLCPLLAGITVVIAKESIINPEVMVKYVSLYEITRLVLVPSFLRLLLVYLNSDQDLIHTMKKSIKLWVSSGEPIPPWLLRDFFDVFPESKIANFYGSTEVTGDVTHVLLDKETLENPNGIPLGLPVTNTALLVFHNDGSTIKILAEGDVGEIGVIGLNVCDGYLREKPMEGNDASFYTLGSLYFRVKDDVKSLHNYLNDINYFTGERYGIMEQTFCASTRNTQQSFLRYSQSSRSENLRKYSIPCGSFLNFGATSSDDDMRKKSRASSICVSGAAVPSSVPCIVADEIELLNKFKGIKSFSEAGALPQEHQMLRRASMPSAGDIARSEISDKRNFPPKLKFRPNIKTTAELITTEVNRVSMSTTTGISSNTGLVNPSAESFFPMTLMQHPIQQFSNISSSFKPPIINAPPDVTITTTPSSGRIAAIYPSVTASISETFYILKQISTLTKEKLAVYATGDQGKIEDGVLYFRGRKDDQVKVKGIRIDPSEIDSAIINSELVENHFLMTVQDENDKEPDSVHEEDSDSTRDSPADSSEEVRGMTLHLKSNEEEETTKDNSSMNKFTSSLNSLIAFVVLKEKKETKEVESSEALLLYLRRQLSETMVPQLAILDRLPVLSSGKVDVQELLKWHHSRGKKSSKQNVLFMMKEEPIELRVLRIICDALGLAHSENLLKKNFFSIGGTSISSVVAVVRLKEMGFRVTLENFLKAPTLAHVVHDILKAKTRAEVMNLFSPSPSQRKNFVAMHPGREERKCEMEKEEEHERNDDEGEEEEKSEVEWMRASYEEERAGTSKLWALHPDLPTLLVGGEVEIQTSPSGVAKGKAQSAQGTKLRINQLYTTSLPKENPDKDITIELIASSFTNRNPLDLVIGVRKESHQELLENLWPFLIRQELSFVVRDQTKEIVGAMITTDFFDEPQVEIPPQMVPIIAIHRVLESKVREEIEGEGGRGEMWAHNVFLATNRSIEPQDNVRLSLHLEKELLKLAAKKSIQGVFTINSNPSNQLLCSHYLGYEQRASLSVHRFELEGEMPFKGAAKDLSLIAMTKKLS